MDTMGPLGEAKPTMDTMGPLGQARPTMDTMGPLGQARSTMDTMGPLGQARPTMDQITCIAKLQIKTCSKSYGTLKATSSIVWNPKSNL